MVCCKLGCQSSLPQPRTSCYCRFFMLPQTVAKRESFFFGRPVVFFFSLWLLKKNMLIYQIIMTAVYPHDDGAHRVTTWQHLHAQACFFFYWHFTWSLYFKFSYELIISWKKKLFHHKKTLILVLHDLFITNLIIWSGLSHIDKIYSTFQYRRDF